MLERSADLSNKIVHIESQKIKTLAEKNGVNVLDCLMKPQLKICSAELTDDYLQYMNQMNIKHCFVMFSNEHSNYDDVNRILEKIRKSGITVDDAGNNFLYKHPSICLGLSDRDYWIEQYNRLNIILGKAGVPVGYIGNSRVSHKGYFVTKESHGALSRTVDMNELLKRETANEKIIDEDKIWENFIYLLKAALPVARQNGMRLSIHPSDPPFPMYEGYASLIYNSECFRRALVIADKIEPNVLAMKFCCGCWLEGGKDFGDILEDLREFIRDDRITTVHFRNVSSPLPYFCETLCEDGYYDMTKVMKLLVEERYDKAIYVDHVFKVSDSTGGSLSQFAYATGYMKGLMHMAYSYHNKEQ